MVRPLTRQRQHVEDVPIPPETEQCYLTIDNDSTIPCTIYIKPNDDTDQLLSSDVSPGKRFVYPILNECNAALEWSETPQLFATDVFVVCSLASYIMMMPFTILTRGIFYLSMFDIILWTCILFLSLYYLCKPRVSQPILESRLTVENLSFRFYQKRTLTEGMMTSELYFDIEEVPSHTLS